MKKFSFAVFAATLTLILLLLLGTVEQQNTIYAADFYAGNPIITNLFTADPSAHVWEANGKLYIYASHDIFPSRGCDLMDRYHVFSTTNMVTWKDEGEILSSDDVSWGRPEGGFMWAPDAAYRNGTYYFYFPHPTGSGDAWNSTWRIGIAKSSKPASDFTCAADGYVKKKDGSPYVTGIDPCIFKDDDGQYYLYTGGGAHSYVAKMQDNMEYLAEEPVEITGTLTDFHEAMWVFKRNGIYYAMYADNTSGENLMRYSTASSPYGPWREGGIVLDGTGCDTTHGSICEYKGHWYLFYHNCEISGNGTLRSVCVDEVTFREDGSIEKVVQTRQGVGNVDTVKPEDVAGNNSKPNPEEFTEKTNYGVNEATLFGNAELEGDGAVHNLHMEGAALQWNHIDGGKGGQAMLTVYYATPDGATALVNSSGNTAGDGYFLKFNQTSGWSDYGNGVARCFIDLNAGTDNTVKLTCGMGGVNITGIAISLKNQEEETSLVKLSVDGYQISTSQEGYRVIFSESDPNQEIVERGLIYGLMNYVNEDDLYIGSHQQSVYSYNITENGRIHQRFNDTFENARSYALTMKFIKNNSFYTAIIGVKAYARLKDGSIIYTDADTFSVYRIADHLHQNQMMSNLQAHDYLYHQILKRVNADYEYCDYDWNQTIVHLD